MRRSAALRLAMFADPADEGWLSMQVAADGLTQGLAPLDEEVVAERIQLPMPRLLRRVPRIGTRHAALNADRLAGRFVAASATARRARGRADVFHIVDHVYAHLTRVLPPGRSGVYCHDLDAFRSVVDPAAEPRPAWFRAITRASLRGLQHAGVVFHSTDAVRRELVGYGVVDPDRLVWAPPGVSAEFGPDLTSGDRSADVLAPLGGRPYLLHVGSSLPRKRLDLLIEIHAALAAAYPDLWLVQRGAEPADRLRDDATRRGFADRLLQPSSVDRPTLAGLYRGASAVLVTSDSEGFGLPVIEALACGAPVVASDIPVLREVGADACTYRAVGDIDGWIAAVAAILDDHDGLTPATRVSQAGHFSWNAHARTVLDAYRGLLAR